MRRRWLLVSVRIQLSKLLRLFGWTFRHGRGCRVIHRFGLRWRVRRGCRLLLCRCRDCVYRLPVHCRQLLQRRRCGDGPLRGGARARVCGRRHERERHAVRRRVLLQRWRERPALVQFCRGRLLWRRCVRARRRPLPNGIFLRWRRRGQGSVRDRRLLVPDGFNLAIVRRVQRWALRDSGWGVDIHERILCWQLRGHRGVLLWRCRKQLRGRALHTRVLLQRRRRRATAMYRRARVWVRRRRCVVGGNQMWGWILLHGGCCDAAGLQCDSGPVLRRGERDQRRRFMHRGHGIEHGRKPRPSAGGMVRLRVCQRSHGAGYLRNLSEFRRHHLPARKLLGNL